MRIAARATSLVKTLVPALLSALAVWGPASVAIAQVEILRLPELVVLLKAGEGRPTPEQVVGAVNAHGPLPGSLGAGNPSRAEFLLPYRGQGAFAEWLAANPDHPRAELERYVILRYPAGTDLDAVAALLRGDGNVVAAGETGTMPFSAAPADPYFASTGDPLTYQWGMALPALNMASAWDLATGHAYLGIPDSGIEGQIVGCFEDEPFETGHEDLRSVDESSGSAQFEGGAWRPRFSRDFGSPPVIDPELGLIPDLCVDELQAEQAQDVNEEFPVVTNLAGHGTHLAGIIAATANNQQGVAGTSWHSSLMVAKTAHRNCGGVFCSFVSPESDDVDIAAGMTWLVDQGAQALNLSFGRLRGGDDTTPILACDPPPDPLGTRAICTALAHAADRGVMVIAASGNSREEVNFPARDSRVIAVGGLEPGGNPSGSTGVFWDDDLGNGFNCFGGPVSEQDGCGTNFGPTQELVAPAKDVLSTFYTGQVWNAGSDCLDDNFGPAGYGRCTGTSMSAPQVAGLAGLLRSVDPLLAGETVRANLRAHASHAASFTPQLGYGLPNARASVEAILGTSAGQLLANRLTPLFSHYSSLAEDFFYTTVPQMSVAALLDTEGAFYGTWGPTVPGYFEFPGAPCIFSPCDLLLPRASVYLFASEKPPYAGAPALVPLYRLSYRGPGGPNRDHAYTWTEAGVLNFRAADYQFDGVEGYMFPFCNPNTACTETPGCKPPGTVPLHRRYNAARDDHAIFPASELSVMEALGYTQVAGGAGCIGYVYPNVDADADTVIDGFEALLGSATNSSDSDCDGLSDGVEVLGYPRSDPRGAPGCPADFIFGDGFETASASAWSASAVSGGGSLSFSDKGAVEGAWALAASTNGSSGAVAYVQDQSPLNESRYRARFYLDLDALTLPAPNKHYVFIARSSSAPVLRLVLQGSGVGKSVLLHAAKDDGSFAASGAFALAGSTALEVEWKAASGAGANNGYASLWVAGNLVATLTGLDNDLQRVEMASLGAVSGVDAGTTGPHRIDAFESRRFSYIGALP